MYCCVPASGSQGCGLKTVQQIRVLITVSTVYFQLNLKLDGIIFMDLEK